jgi:beta-phosphoglucomutase-like phosphatase (HAD superfamily)
MNLQPGTPPPFTAIFDWDGVVIDSEDYHREGWERLAREIGQQLPEGYWANTFGRKNADVITEVLKWNLQRSQIIYLAERKEALYREVVMERGLQPLAGIPEWLDVLAGAGIPCAIGSATVRANIDLSLGLVGASSFFRIIVTAEDVTKGKPDPEVFLKAAALLGASPGTCVVFEDSLPGLEAARRAGMIRVGVATTHPAEVIAPHADFVVRRLDELSVEQLSDAILARAVKII